MVEDVDTGPGWLTVEGDAWVGVSVAPVVENDSVVKKVLVEGDPVAVNSSTFCVLVSSCDEVPVGTLGSTIAGIDISCSLFMALSIWSIFFINFGFFLGFLIGLMCSSANSKLSVDEVSPVGGRVIASSSSSLEADLIIDTVVVVSSTSDTFLLNRSMPVDSSPN